MCGGSSRGRQRTSAHSEQVLFGFWRSRLSKLAWTIECRFVSLTFYNEALSNQSHPPVVAIDFVSAAEASMQSHLA